MFDGDIDIDSIILWLMLILMSSLTTLGIYIAYTSNSRWIAYSKSHHCVAKGTRSGQVITAFGPTVGIDGAVGTTMTTIVSPDQTIYVCDNNEIRIR